MLTDEEKELIEKFKLADIKINKEEVIVPGYVRYITEWTDFLSNFKELPCIIDKQITGCGFTEWCLVNDLNVILCSPRKILLENKEDQHSGDIFYAKNEMEKDLTFDKNLTNTKIPAKPDPEELLEDVTADCITRYKSRVKSWYLHKAVSEQKPCKILVTYDSFRLVKEALIEEGALDDFLIVIDEFQSVFVDSRFKSTTEMDLLNQLYGLEKIMFVSATPMIDKYVVQLPVFRDLKYYKLNWETENPYRVTKPDLEVKKVFNNNSITNVAVDIITTYRNGDYERLVTEIDGKQEVIESREAVFYVNSVKNICDILKKANLKQSECNILCANTESNLRKIKAAMIFDETKKKDLIIGKVPERGKPHKMFTFCTRTVYLGADFYSTCARSFIFSDANVDSLSVDITLDLPQILGRQRLECNPWKNRATLYYKVINTDATITDNEFRNKLLDKLKATDSLLRSYTKTEERDKWYLADKYKKGAKSENYRDDYVAVNVHAGRTLIPEFNLLVRLADERTYEIQQIDFKDRFSVFRQVSTVGNIKETSEDSVFLCNFNTNPTFTEKMKMLCNYRFMSPEHMNCILDQLPADFKNYYLVLGPVRIKSLSYQKSKLEKEFNNILAQGLSEAIYTTFEVGKRYAKSDIKETLGRIYKEAGITSTPKASDLEKYFEIKQCQIVDKETGKHIHAFDIISIHGYVEEDKN